MIEVGGTETYLRSAMLIIQAELQKVVELPPNVKFMAVTFLTLTQCKITENTTGKCCAPDKNM